LVRSFLFGEVGAELSATCQKALQTVQHCLYLPMQSEDQNDAQNFLPEKFASRMVLLLIMVMEMVENDGKHSGGGFTII
jgi:hypothetical protein